uniref:dolichyl-phosphate-mannose--protein mannosyltransferase n=1 Tax=Timema bartmani TaxID=61472 RepID=A0A7R9EU94_9NEOP|nr:unnamed protein product [Timema bartmani]
MKFPESHTRALCPPMSCVSGALTETETVEMAGEGRLRIPGQPSASHDQLGPSLSGIEDLGIPSICDGERSMATKSSVNFFVTNGATNDGFTQLWDSKFKRRHTTPWDAALPMSRPPSLLSVLVVAVAAVVCYANSVDGHFVFDDSEAVVNNEDLRPNRPLWNLLHNDFWGTRLTHNHSHKSYRPLTVLSFRWNYWMSEGLKPWGFHVTNVLLHCLVSVLSLLVYDRLFGGHSPRAALLSALLFSVHPVHSEAVAGVVGRADLLCALLYFLSFLVYCSALSIKGSFHHSSLVILSMVLAALAMLAKEQGITVIGLCSAYDIIIASRIHPSSMSSFLYKNICIPFSKKRRKSVNGSWENGSVNNRVSCSDEGEVELATLRPLVLRHFAMLMTGIVVLLLRWRVMGSIPPTFQTVDNPASFSDNFLIRILTYNYIYALNVWLLVCPEWLCFDWSMGCVPLLNWQDPRVAAVVTLWLGIAVILWRVATLPSSPTHRSLSMSLALTVIPFLPATNLFFRVGFVIAERVLYLPSAGFCMLVVLGVRQLAVLSNAKRLLQLGYLYLVVILGIRACWRSSEWRSEKLLFTSGLAVCPLNAKVHYNIAKNAADSGNKTYAVLEYTEALRLNPEYDQAMNNLANILKDERKLTEAELLLRRAVRLREDFAAAWMNLGIVLSSMRRHKEAEESYFTALKHRKKYPDCYYNLGNLYLDQQKYEDAYTAWRNATSLKPTHTVAWSNMIIMLDNIGEMYRAELVAQEALSVLPLEPSLHFNLANTLGKAGRFAEAEKHFSEALALDPNNSVYYTNLGTNPLCVKNITLDEFLTSKLGFMLSFSLELEQFLTEYQSNQPLLPFIFADLNKLLEHLLNKIVKCDVMNSANTSKKLLAVDLKKQSNMKSLSTVDIGFAASALKGIKDIKILEFRGDCQKFLIELCNKRLHKCPLSYKIVKGASCLSPAVMLNPSVRTYRITSALEILLEKKQLSSVQADVVKRDYLDFESKQEVIDYLKQFTSCVDQFDKFFMNIFSRVNASQELQYFTKKILVFFHRNAAAERNFSINKEYLVENLHEDSLIDQRVNYDAVTAAGGLLNMTI